MTSNLLALCFDANDPLRLARFWAGVLGWDSPTTIAAASHSYPMTTPGSGSDSVPTQEKKTEQNRMHFDLTSASVENQQQTVARSLELGARHIDIGQRPEEEHVVLADPEGNEFCVVEPGNDFLADCGFIGALACDGSQDVGLLLERSVGWPLVWDQDQETAIRSPRGGPKITWGGPPLTPKTGKNRLHFDIAPPLGGDQHAEVDRLVSLGATRVDTARCEGNFAALVDPDGNDFCVWPPTA